jgi:thiol-disulfide isomerase/thioredoxin
VPENPRAKQWLLAGLVAAAIAGWPLACANDHRGTASNATPQPGAKVEHAKLDYVLKDMNGQQVKLADYKGKPLLINFWATYCIPCKAEIPTLIALQEKYKDQLAILGISVGDTPPELQAFAKEYKINYPVLVSLDQDEMLEAYEASFQIPISWFVKKDGTVYLKKMGSESPEWFDAQVRALF